MTKKTKRTLIGERLHYFRMLNGLTQQEVANSAGISRENYASYETRTDPPMDTLFKIINVFNISISDFMNDIENKNYVAYNESSKKLIFNDANLVNVLDKPKTVKINYEGILTMDEQFILSYFRNLSDNDKKRILDFLKNDLDKKNS